MIEHIVLFRLKDGLEQSDIEPLLQGMTELGTRLGGIVTMSVGANFSPRSQGYTHALHVRFADRPSLDAYRVDPDHLALIRRFDEVTHERLIVDYEGM